MNQSKPPSILTQSGMYNATDMSYFSQQDSMNQSLKDSWACTFPSLQEDLTEPLNPFQLSDSAETPYATTGSESTSDPLTWWSSSLDDAEEDMDEPATSSSLFGSQSDIPGLDLVTNAFLLPIDDTILPFSAQETVESPSNAQTRMETLSLDGHLPEGTSRPVPLHAPDHADVHARGTSRTTSKKLQQSDEEWLPPSASLQEEALLKERTRSSRHATPSSSTSSRSERSQRRRRRRRRGSELQEEKEEQEQMMEQERDVVHSSPPSKRRKQHQSTSQEEENVDISMFDMTKVVVPREVLLQVNGAQIELFTQTMMEMHPKLTKKEIATLKRQQRLVKNRESAQASRDRKKNELQALQVVCDRLEAEKQELEQQFDQAMVENARLKEELRFISKTFEANADLQQLWNKVTGANGIPCAKAASAASQRGQRTTSNARNNWKTTGVCLMMVLLSFGFFTNPSTLHGTSSSSMAATTAPMSLPEQYKKLCEGNNCEKVANIFLSKSDDQQQSLLDGLMKSYWDILGADNHSSEDQSGMHATSSISTNMQDTQAADESPSHRIGAKTRALERNVPLTTNVRTNDDTKAPARRRLLSLDSSHQTFAKSMPTASIFDHTRKKYEEEEEVEEVEDPRKALRELDWEDWQMRILTDLSVTEQQHLQRPVQLQLPEVGFAAASHLYNATMTSAAVAANAAMMQNTLHPLSSQLSFSPQKHSQEQFDFV